MEKQIQSKIKALKEDLLTQNVGGEINPDFLADMQDKVMEQLGFPASSEEEIDADFFSHLQDQVINQTVTPTKVMSLAPVLRWAASLVGIVVLIVIGLRLQQSPTSGSTMASQLDDESLLEIALTSATDDEVESLLLAIEESDDELLTDDELETLLDGGLQDIDPSLLETIF